MIPSSAESQNESASAHASAAGTLVVATAVVAAVVVNGSGHRVSLQPDPPVDRRKSKSRISDDDLFRLLQPRYRLQQPTHLRTLCKDFTKGFHMQKSDQV